MQAVNYSTFYHYTIYNRSSFNLSNVFIGDWSDVDLGNYNDDYIGTDSLNNFAYCYNADNNDENVSGITGYGNKPPVVSHAIIKTPCTNDGVDNDHDGLTDENGEQFLLDRTTYYLNNIGSVNPAMSNPAIAIHYYNYMSGKWNDGSFFTTGGNAYGGTTPTKYVYPGNPATNTGWTEASAGNAAGDRRVIFSSGPFNFPAGGKIEWGYAIVFSQDTTQAVNTITQFNSRVQRDVRNVRYYDETHQTQQCTSSFNVGLKTNSMGLYAHIYPNPANSKVHINLSEQVKLANLLLTDLSGRIIKQSIIKDDSKTSLDIEGLESGVYFIKINGDKINLTQKLIKN
jgi:Secretion system C-terminal sorting domain